MLLIFGLSDKRQLLAVLRYVCETCGQEAAHQLVEVRRRFTVFFIPLIPLGSRYVDTCSWCSRSIQVSREQALTAAQGWSTGRMR